MDTPEELSATSETESSNSNTAFIAFLLCMILAIMLFHTLRAPRWEYEVVSIQDETFISQTTKMGADGWELVFARRATDSALSSNVGYEMIFKRRKLF